VSSTRLILSKGAEFEGKLVRAFGNFVVGTPGAEGLVIGVIIFVILVAVQFIVITKGATRVSEVAARFTLDGLPGKQMAIEAEYNSGAITEEEAAQRKQELQREADFYGAMDGASKFISGNVIVGIIITLVNVIGGMIIGITLHNEPLSVAVDTYVSLTIGDGLITQFPLLMISTSTGIIVTVFQTGAGILDCGYFSHRHIVPPRVSLVCPSSPCRSFRICRFQTLQAADKGRRQVETG
jgi:flagellar biosynthesis protein FlhA